MYVYILRLSVLLLCCQKQMQMQRMNELDSKAHVFESRGELLKAIAMYQAEYEDLFAESTSLGTRTSIANSVRRGRR